MPATETTLWSWIHDPAIPRSGVNNKPLPKGDWGDQYWPEAQTSRCSNNYPLANPQIPEPFGPTWVVTSSTDPVGQITFDVAVDQSGSDLTIWKNQKNGGAAGQLTQEPHKDARGLYICNVHGATGPFSIVAQTEVP